MYCGCDHEYTVVNLYPWVDMHAWKLYDTLCDIHLLLSPIWLTLCGASETLQSIVGGRVVVGLTHSGLFIKCIVNITGAMWKNYNIAI